MVPQPSPSPSSLDPVRPTVSRLPSTVVGRTSLPRIRMKRLVLVVATAFAFAPAVAQQTPRIYTAADYDRAVKMLAPALTNTVVNASISANWLPDGRMWYRGGATNTDFVLV